MAAVTNLILNITPPSPDELISEITCLHEEVRDGACVVCSAVVWRHQKTISKSTQHIPSIEKDLNRLEIKDKIKQRAIEIHQIIMKAQGYPIYRDPNRTKLIFFCLYQAYQELGDKPTPYAVADMVGMARNLISNAMSMCSEVQTGYRKKLTFVTPMDRLPYICKEMNLTQSALESMRPICQRMMEQYAEIDNENPVHVAGAIIKLYMDINGILFDEETFLSILNIKKIKCLDKLYALANEYY